MSIPSPRLASLPLLLSLLLGLGACEDRVGQCNELIGRMNPRTEALIVAVEGLSQIEAEPERLDALVTSIEQTERELAALQPEDPRLAEFARRYHRQLDEARRAADAMRTAAASKDPKGLNAAAKQTDAFLDGQAAIIEELNAYCTGP